MNELVFQVEPDEDGGYVARTKLPNGSIITQGDTLDELKAMIKDAVSGYFFDKPDELPKTIRLQVNEVFAFA
ncbi:2-oxoisovalerate dehydrogenase E1 subunit beta [Spirosoma sp. HMF3257]|uniref:2-oxoisovalerate dehydrogenase E1 subunit beta n=1 Tax=Spirosoma telluris TaxID=2183553 RepID=A0A327NNU0_9BACT|nr:2-oxoisovalerate dehydrogenase E1 subunit beta [Spirosoma telluris]RAI76902.1 2-oxoisovalerate dehydrogenase E1 subunit beta [Spirosoma telluris]